MGQGDEYSRDAYNYDLAYDSDDSDDVDFDLHPEDWQDMYSQELLDGWMVIRGYADEHYLPISGTFNDFVNLVLEPDLWYTNANPHPSWVAMWNMMANFPIISERVQVKNFYAWAENYIGYS
jgi:hypothetical protein